MKAEELLKLQNKWVAFSKDRKKIVRQSKSLKDLLSHTKDQKDLIISFVNSSEKYLSP